MLSLHSLAHLKNGETQYLEEPVGKWILMEVLVESLVYPKFLIVDQDYVEYFKDPV